MRIIYMGTPYFAVPPLELLAKSGYNIVAVVTAPDKPAGRGLKLKSSPVKEKAQELGIPVLQPLNLKGPQFIAQLKELNPDIQFVVAFRMLPEQVWNLPPLGTYNLHASLLPDYRGAAPINHAVINGETITGLTTFKLQHEIDTGDIAFQTQVNIQNEETAGELHDKMMQPGAELVLKTIKSVENGSLQLAKQNSHSALHAAPKLSPDFCKIDFNLPATQVHNKIRGLSPLPGATAELINGNLIFQVKLLKSKISTIHIYDKPGSILIEKKNHLYVRCADEWIEITELKPAGKKAMRTTEFLNGFKPEDEVRFL